MNKNKKKNKVRKKYEIELTSPDTVIIGFSGYPGKSKISNNCKIFCLKTKNLQLFCEKIDFPLLNKNKKTSSVNLKINSENWENKNPLKPLFNVNFDFFPSGNGILRDKTSLCYISIKRNIIKRGPLFPEYKIIQMCFDYHNEYCCLIATKSETEESNFLIIWVNRVFKIIKREVLEEFDLKNFGEMRCSFLRDREVFILMKSDKVIKTNIVDGIGVCELIYQGKQ